ncbi:DUF4190 domain-containing protein [Brachybacterium sp. AOP29-B2-41]|uniref:DUF4190 domain-containing protein n=1 Tax=Brachybacterium sp. AOP29-B2-41 TaxID=3457704 RepID=UPI0040332E7E
MSAGYGGGLPDYNGGPGSRSSGEGRGGEPLYGSDPYAPDPYATDPYSADAHASDPYAQNQFAQDPYATDPLEADGFGPVFSSSAPAQSGGYAVASYDSSPQYGSQQYGTHPSGPPGYGQFPPPLPSSGAGITGFVLGLLALTMCAGLTAPVGIIFAMKGMKETGPTAINPKGGRGLAIAGLVTSLIGLIPFLFFVLYFAFVIVAIIAGATSA